MKSCKEVKFVRIELTEVNRSSSVPERFEGKKDIQSVSHQFNL